MATGTDPHGFVPMAEVVKAVGLRGEIKLYPLLDFHAPVLGSRFAVWQDGTRAELESARPAGACVAVKPAGCASREAAEALIGRQIGFWREDYLDAAFPRPEGGLPFRYLGRPVRDTAGTELGVVQEVRRYASQVLLVLDLAGREVMIPAVPPILQRDDGLQGPLIVDPPEGLLDG